MTLYKHYYEVGGELRVSPETSLRWSEYSRYIGGSMVRMSARYLGSETREIALVNAL